MKYIKKVQTNEEFDKLLITNTIAPSVVLNQESGEVFYINKWRNYLTIEALEDGLTVSFSLNTCEYCIDRSGEWVELDANTTTPAINAGQSISFKAQNLTPTTSAGIGTFTISKQCALTGSCMSMVYGDDVFGKTEIFRTYQFYKLFSGATTITQVSRDFLPATTLADHCYDRMFKGCTSLTTVPELPATTLASYCYYQMFKDCTSLTTAPELPATILKDRCYYHMFDGCTSLTTAPELPATTLADFCYYSMFNGCTSLTTALTLPATTLASSCYRCMFEGCTSLTTVPELPATTLASYCYYQMFKDCTSLTTAPELPATSLTAASCYFGMFQGCTSLTYIKMMATNIYGSNCLSQWVSGVASSGTFVKNSAATWDVVGIHGVPEGWTIETADA